jgi:periplasmic protein TonB
MRYYEEEERDSFQKYRAIIGCGLIAAIAIAVWFGQRFFRQTSRPRQEQRVVMVNLPPPPVRAAPPPPPAQPPPIPTESEQKMIAQEPVSETESKPDETSKVGPSPGESPGPGTNIQGDGPADGFGLRAGNGLGGGTGKTTSGGGRNSRWGWYAGQVQGAISHALQSNTNTRAADFRIDVRIWADRNGRITRARIVGSTGDAALDNAITNEVLVGLILQEPPPEEMPMPIVLRLTARHPNVALSKSYP